MSVPVLVIAFNRPSHTRRVLEAVSGWEIPALYVAVDGPRDGHVTDDAKVAQVRALANHLSVPYPVHRLFRDENLGCTRGVPNSIDWFLSDVEAGIILEDDCLPTPSFLHFCAQLLPQWAENHRVHMVSGQNPLDRSLIPSDQYHFFRNTMIWGWATWRSSWQAYDSEMSDWPRLRQTDWLLDLHDGDRAAARFWRETFDRVYSGEIDTWGYRWKYSVWSRDGLSIAPPFNLVENIGFDGEATHTTASEPPVWTRHMLRGEPEFPLQRPPAVRSDPTVTRWINRNVYGARPLRTVSLRRSIRRALRIVGLEDKGVAIVWRLRRAMGTSSEV